MSIDGLVNGTGSSVKFLPRFGEYLISAGGRIVLIAGIASATLVEAACINPDERPASIPAKIDSTAFDTAPIPTRSHEQPAFEVLLANPYAAKDYFADSERGLRRNPEVIPKRFNIGDEKFVVTLKRFVYDFPQDRDELVEYDAKRITVGGRTISIDKYYFIAPKGKLEIYYISLQSSFDTADFPGYNIRDIASYTDFKGDGIDYASYTLGGFEGRNPQGHVVNFPDYSGRFRKLSHPQKEVDEMLSRAGFSTDLRANFAVPQSIEQKIHPERYASNGALKNAPRRL